MTGLVAVCSRSFSRNRWLRDRAAERFEHLRFNEAGAQLTGRELRTFLAGAERVVVGLERVDSALLTDLPELRVVAKYGVGLDRIDLAALEAHDVHLGWTPGVNRRSVAELALGFAIVLLRRLHRSHVDLRAGTWRKLGAGRTLSGSTVGIVGCGHIGSDLLRLLRPFGCRVLVHDIRADLGFEAGREPERVDLRALLAQADIVTLHLPLDASTRHILDRDALAAMKDGALLINTARGGLVDEVALADELGNGRLGGAAFDVFEEEPASHHPLLAIDSFIASPHIGGSTEEAVRAMGMAAIEGLDNARPVAQLRPLIFRR